MKRYISAEKLKAEIERLYKDARKKALTEDMSFWTGFGDGLDAIEQFIDSIQQEQPELPDNLDEAAKEYDETESWRYEALPYPRRAAFIEGAKWMARQMKQEQPVLPGIEDHGIPGKDYIPVEWVNACETYGKWKIVKQEQSDVDLENEMNNDYDSPLWDGEVVSWMTYTRIARHFYELGKKEK